MSGVFSVDNPFFATMGKICDMMALSLLWLVCCLPIVTIGPATTALYYAIVKVIRRGRGYVFRQYIHSFKENFKVGAISTLIMVAATVVLLFDYQFSVDMMAENPSVGSIFFGIYCVAIAILCGMFMFIFPVLSRFTVTVKGLFKTTFFMCLRHLLTTILLFAIVTVTTLGILLTVVGIIILPAICCLLCSFLIERIFKKYMPKPEESDEESGTDTWYLE